MADYEEGWDGGRYGADGHEHLWRVYNSDYFVKNVEGCSVEGCPAVRPTSWANGDRINVRYEVVGGQTNVIFETVSRGTT